MNRLYLLGASLVPLLGATRTLSEGVTIGACAALMNSLHQLLLAPLRQRLASWAYVVASLLLLAALACCVQLALRAWLLPLALALGHYPALLCLQCLAADHLLPNPRRWRLLSRFVCAFFATCLLLGASLNGWPRLPACTWPAWPRRPPTARTAIGLVQSPASGPRPPTSSRNALIS